jgi:hypothetical protein
MNSTLIYIWITYRHARYNIKWTYCYAARNCMKMVEVILDNIKQEFDDDDRVNRCEPEWSSVDGDILEIFPFSITSTLALGSSYPSVHNVSGAISLGVKWQGREADHSPLSSAEVKNGGAILPLRRMSSRRIAQLIKPRGKLCLSASMSKLIEIRWVVSES